MTAIMRAREFLEREKQILSMPGHPRAKSEAISELMKEYAEGDLDRFEDALMMARFEDTFCGSGDDEWGFTPENTDSDEEEDDDDKKDMNNTYPSDDDDEEEINEITIRVNNSNLNQDEEDEEESE